MISKNLSLAEVTKSATAERMDIDNNPNAAQKSNLKAIAENVFQPLRNHFGVPIGISSGFRCKALNDAVGGSKTSQHCKGEALDLDADIFGRLTNAQIFLWLKQNVDFDQLIWEYGTDNEPAWVHVSYKANGKNRGQILKAVRGKGYQKFK